MASILSTHFGCSLKARVSADLQPNVTGPPPAKGGGNTYGLPPHSGRREAGNKKKGDLQGGQLNERLGAYVL